MLLVLTLMTGCATRPVSADRDGPLPNPPAELAKVPDAVPRLEPIRVGGPNKPYEVLGERYLPLTGDDPYVDRGLASWYGRKFHGRPTASGEVYNMYAMTAAHATLPIPSYARVRNPANGKEVIVRINDRGPFHKGRIIDLSYTAALKLDLLRGVAPVEVRRITYAEIRAGNWQKPADPPPLEPVPDVRKMVQEKLDSVFTAQSNPQNVRVSEARPELRGRGWTACVKAELTSANGKPLGEETYRISIDGDVIVDRRRALPEDGCDVQTYQPI